MHLHRTITSIHFKHDHSRLALREEFSSFLLFTQIPDGNSLGFKGNKREPSKIPPLTPRTRIGCSIIWLLDYSNVLVGGTCNEAFVPSLPLT